MSQVNGNWVFSFRPLAVPQLPLRSDIVTISPLDYTFMHRNLAHRDIDRQHLTGEFVSIIDSSSVDQTNHNGRLVIKPSKSLLRVVTYR